MGEWVDFREIRANVSLAQVLELYGVTNLTKKENKLIGPCPVHGGDNPRAFHADLEKNIWHCFTGCQGGGNQLDFVVRKEGISVRDAALKLKHLMDEGTTTPTGEKRKARPPLGNLPIDVKLQLYPDHPHIVEERGLSPETAKHFGVGYCSKGLHRGNIAIPIHNKDGELVAFAGRRLKPQLIEEHGKYLLPRGFNKSLELYNFHRALQASTETVILVEGFFATLKLYELGFANVVASMGVSLSPQQAELLKEAGFSKVVLLFDGDEAGAIGSFQALEQLQAHGLEVALIDLPDHTSPDNLPQETLNWLMTGVSLGLRSISFRVEDWT